VSFLRYIIREPFSPLPRWWRRQRPGFLPLGRRLGPEEHALRPRLHWTVKCPGRLAVSSCGTRSRSARRRARPGPPS